jgi:hypothetical protein
MTQEKDPLELALEQIEMLANFSDASFDYPALSFEEVARKLLGPEPFKATASGKQFEKECRAMFDRERE